MLHESCGEGLLEEVRIQMDPRGGFCFRDLEKTKEKMGGGALT